MQQIMHHVSTYHYYFWYYYYWKAFFKLKSQYNIRKSLYRYIWSKICDASSHFIECNDLELLCWIFSYLMVRFRFISLNNKHIPFDLLFFYLEVDATFGGESKSKIAMLVDVCNEIRNWITKSLPQIFPSHVFFFFPTQFFLPHL